MKTFFLNRLRFDKIMLMICGLVVLANPVYAERKARVKEIRYPPMLQEKLEVGYFLLRPNRGAEYCNERVCLSAIISSKLHVRSSPVFSAGYLWPYFGRPLAAL